MKAIPLPKEVFSGKKFGLRYGLDPLKDFFADEKFIYVPDNFPTAQPIFEAPDLPGKTLEQRIVELEAKTVNLPLPTLPLGGPR